MLGRLLFAAGALLLSMSAALAQDKREGDLSDWFRSLERMDGVSCCGLADGVWADWVGTDQGNYIVEVTGGGPRNHDWAPVGRRYSIPPEFVVWKFGNKLGRPILFLRPSTLEVICFIPATGA